MPYTDAPAATFFPVVYERIRAVGDPDRYADEAETNLPVTDGVILSPYYTLKINGVSAPVYAARTAHGIHSFLYTDAVLDRDAPGLDIELCAALADSPLFVAPAKVEVLPLGAGIEADAKGGRVRFRVNAYGSFTVVINESHLQPFTLFVAPVSVLTVPEGWKLREIAPGEYAQKDTNFIDKRTVYRFVGGRYRTDTIRLPEESIAFFERGAYFEVAPSVGDLQPALMCEGGKNVRIEGRALFDFSACCGGETPPGYAIDKQGLLFGSLDRLHIEGLVAINSQSWTLCLNDCTDALVTDCMMFGYRVFSDGIMLSDCKDSTVRRNFVRTGDDAFETKSTTQSGLTANVLFCDNAAWTDKAVAYGCIYEARHDTTGVRFERCSVGFALGTWSRHLGCCVLQLGDRKGARISGITFCDIEIYATSNAMCNVYIGGSGGGGMGYGAIDGIRFENIRAYHALHDVVHIQTWDDVHCHVGTLTFRNVVRNGVLFTKDNLAQLISVYARYDLSRLVIEDSI